MKKPPDPEIEWITGWEAFLSFLLADKSCDACGQNEIYEVSSMRKVELAEESSDKRN